MKTGQSEEVLIAAARSLTCARCGTVFGCDRDSACWCMDETFRVPMPATGSGEDCLCPTCLRKYATSFRGAAAPK